MARYIARAANYSHGIGEPTIALVNGIEMETGKKRVASFQNGVLLNHETELGLKTFTFKGLADGVDPATRLSVFDTRDYQKAHNLTDEEREQIEAILDRSPALGTDFIKVEELRAPKPFNSYDELEADKIISLVVVTGTDPDVAYRYELENQQREELLEAFVELGAEKVAAPKELEHLTLADGPAIIVSA